MNGFNRDPAEYGGGGQEYSSAEESRSFAGNPEANESNASPARAKKRRNQALTSLAGFAVAATVAVAGVTAFSSLPATAELSATAMHTSVAYEVTAEGEGLDVVLFNDFVRFTQPLEAGANSGVFGELLPNVEYTVAVVGETSFGEKTVASTKVRTTKTPDPVTEWRGVDYQCLCGYDGYFHFTMDFTDENGYFTDFEASVTDSFGTVSRCVFTEDLHAEQFIDICNEVSLYKQGVFRLTCRSTEHGESETVVLCEVSFEI